MPSASFELYDVIRANIPDATFIGGTVVTENTTPTRAAGKGWTVAKNGTGVYRITFNRKVARIYAAVGIYCGAEARLLKKVAHVEGSNFIEFRFENTSAAAAEPAVTDQLEFIALVSTNRHPKT